MRRISWFGLQKYVKYAIIAKYAIYVYYDIIVNYAIYVNYAPKFSGPKEAGSNSSSVKVCFTFPSSPHM